jgi:cytochrome c-type protein NapB
MRKRILFGAVMVAAGFSLSASAVQDVPIPDEDLGLSKTSVFDNPAPPIIEYKAGDPGTNKLIVRSYDTAPPMISHTIKDMVPITRETNLCKDCHMQPELIGQKLAPGIPVPIPASHYVDVKKAELYMGRWNCTQCHRPQANAKLLVQSTFKKAK